MIVVIIIIFYREVKDQCREMGNIIQKEYLKENYLDNLGFTDMSIILILLLFIGLVDVNHIIQNLELVLYPLESRSFMFLYEEEDGKVTLLSNINNFMYYYGYENNDNEYYLVKQESGIIVDEGIYIYIICF